MRQWSDAAARMGTHGAGGAAQTAFTAIKGESLRFSRTVKHAATGEHAQVSITLEAEVPKSQAFSELERATRTEAFHLAARGRRRLALQQVDNAVAAFQRAADVAAGSEAVLYKAELDRANAAWGISSLYQVAQSAQAGAETDRAKDLRPCGEHHLRREARRYARRHPER